MIEIVVTIYKLNLGSSVVPHRLSEDLIYYSETVLKPQPQHILVYHWVSSLQRDAH